VAAVGAVLVVLLMLGATRQAAVTLLCAASGVFLLLSAASFFGLKINFLDFVALPITIGIGIDYAVNIAARHRAEGPGSSGRIVMAAGPAVALCSYTTVVGYASLLLSDNQGIRSFGLAALIGELTCLCAALALAPALLDLRRRRRAAESAAVAGTPVLHTQST
jgi:predicted RND superfamily exporter protein